MGLTYADIILMNSADWVLSKRKQIPESDVKQMTVRALVDSGAFMLTINESIKRQLDLEVVEKVEVKLADGSVAECEIVSPIDVLFKTRSTSCQAIVLPGTSDVRLSTITLEGMDVIVDLKNQKVTLPPERPYIARTKIK